MGRLCEGCERRPQGLEGHERIALHDGRTADGKQLFRCERCGTLWTRDYQGSGLFVWVEAEEPA